MARKPMVTRTIITTEANVLCLNIKTGEPFEKMVTLPRTYKDEKSLMKQVSSVIDNEEQKAVHVKEKREVETLYGMSEQEFIDNAVVLPPRSKEELEGAEQDTADTEVATTETQTKNKNK